MNEFRTASMRPFDLALAGLYASILVPLALGACGSSTPPGKTPAEHASFMESTRCGPDDDDKALAPVLGGNAVVAVQPLYGAAGSSKGGQQATLRGASLTVSALPGMTPEWLDRALECHSAKSTLGGAASPDDPFFLPDSNVDIDVRPAKDGFDVAVTAFYPADAQRVLDRALAFKAKAAAPSK